MKDERYQILPIELLRPGRYQPRRDFEPGKLQELADSILQQGLLQPIIVRAYQHDYEIIAGERRWRAAQLAGIFEVPCIIKSYTDEQIAIATTIENIQREDLNPLEEAYSYKRLIDEFGYTHEHLAKTLGINRLKVTHSLRLLALEERVQALIVNGSLTPGHAKVLAGLPLEQQYAFALQSAQKGWSVRRMEQAIKQQGDNTKPLPATTVSADKRHLALYAQQLSEQFGAEIELEPISAEKGGWLKIRYYDNATLEGLLARMGIQLQDGD